MPWELADIQFTETISKISPTFAAIYNQAHKAELTGLDLACGPAYRKSLEFLIKDYIIGLNPSDDATIKGMALAACITKYAKDSRVVAVAERAVWLGNDEVHYERKWEAKDLDDLKNLIQLTMHWIEMEELTRKAVSEMPNPLYS